MQTAKTKRHGHRLPARYLINGPLSFSDQIAFDQFVLAVERNFLLHITAGLNMTVVGLAMFRFFSKNSNDFYEAVGIGAFFVAGMVMAKGAKDFYFMKRDMDLMKSMIDHHQGSSTSFMNSG